MAATMERHASRIHNELERMAALHLSAPALAKISVASAQQAEENLVWKLCPELRGLLSRIRDWAKFMFTNINFDIDANGNPLPDGTQLDVPANPYQAFGVSFSAIPGPDAGGPMHVWVRKPPVDQPPSPPNVVTLAGPPAIVIADNEQFGKIRVSFGYPHPSVSITVRIATPFEMLSPGPTPYLNAYNSSGTLLATASVPASEIPKANCELGPPYDLVVSSDAADISYVEFSGAYDPDYDPLFGIFDNLTFRRF